MTKAPALITKAGRTIRKGQLRAPLRAAIALIVGEGLSISDAAKRVGYQPDSLSAALQKPHVRAYRADVKRTWLDGETSQAWARVISLAKTADSEKVQLEANKTVLSAAGELQPQEPERRESGPTITFIRNETHVHAVAESATLPGVWFAQEAEIN